MSGLLIVDQLPKFNIEQLVNNKISVQDLQNNKTYTYTVFGAYERDKKEFFRVLRILAGLARVLPNKQKYPPFLRYIVKVNSKYYLSRSPFTIEDNAPVIANSKGLDVQPKILRKLSEIMRVQFRTNFLPYKTAQLQVENIQIFSEPYFSHPKLLNAYIPIMYTYEANALNPIYIISLMALFPHEILGDIAIVMPDKRIYIVDIKQSRNSRGLYVSKRPLEFKGGEIVTKHKDNPFYQSDNIVRFTVVVDQSREGTLTVSKVKPIRRLIEIIYNQYMSDTEYSVPIVDGDYVRNITLSNLPTDKYYRITKIN